MGLLRGLNELLQLRTSRVWCLIINVLIGFSTLIFIGDKLWEVQCESPTFTVAWHPKRPLLAFACDDKDGKYDSSREAGTVKLFGLPNDSWWGGWHREKALACPCVCIWSALLEWGGTEYLEVGIKYKVFCWAACSRCLPVVLAVPSFPPAWGLSCVGADASILPLGPPATLLLGWTSGGWLLLGQHLVWRGGSRRVSGVRDFCLFVCFFSFRMNALKNCSVSSTVKWGYQYLHYRIVLWKESFIR